MAADKEAISYTKCNPLLRDFVVNKNVVMSVTLQTTTYIYTFYYLCLEDQSYG